MDRQRGTCTETDEVLASSPHIETIGAPVSQKAAQRASIRRQGKTLPLRFCLFILPSASPCLLGHFPSPPLSALPSPSPHSSPALPHPYAHVSSRKSVRLTSSCRTFFCPSSCPLFIKPLPVPADIFRSEYPIYLHSKIKYRSIHGESERERDLLCMRAIHAVRNIGSRRLRPRSGIIARARAGMRFAQQLAR